MITISIYEDQGQDRYKVHHIEDEGEPIDITEQYELVACDTDDGRKGFAVFKREN